MASTFGGLNIAGSGLRAANAALNTTANNVSNAETDGYSRQKVVQTAAQALRTYTAYGCTGSGVETVGVERQRDDFYDAKYWNNLKKYGEYSIKQYYCAQIEEYFKDGVVSTIPSPQEKISMAMEHITLLCSLKGEYIGIREARKHASWYIKGLSGAAQLRNRINTATSLDEMGSILSELL